MSKLLLSPRNILLTCSASLGRGSLYKRDPSRCKKRAPGYPLPPAVAIAKHFTRWGLEGDQTNLSELLQANYCLVAMYYMEF